jgi:hypothetical protein
MGNLRSINGLPSGRLRKPPHDDEQEEQWDDLEGDGEAPADGRSTLVDV